MPGTPATPKRVSLAYTVDSQWRNRDEHVVGRDQIVAFLTRKWERELDYVLRKSLGASGRTGWRCASSTSATTPTGSGTAATATSCGSSPPEGLMARREASINDVKIDESERRYFGPRPESEHGIDIPLW